jgi:cytochrome c556
MVDSGSYGVKPNTLFNTRLTLKSETTMIAVRITCMKLSSAALLLAGTLGLAQAPPVASVKQIMLDVIHPSSNDILLAIYRGGPKDEKEWAAVRRSALTLAESGNLLMLPGRALGSSNDQGDWMTDAKLLVDAGSAAYKAAQAKDGNTLASLAGAIDASCTTCHKRYRPSVFPKDGGSK